jgi:hypothetical protein
MGKYGSIVESEVPEAWKKADLEPSRKALSEHRKVTGDVVVEIKKANFAGPAPILWVSYEAADPLDAQELAETVLPPILAQL